MRAFLRSALLLAIAGGSPAPAYDLGEQVSVHGVLSLGVQCQEVREGDDRCRSALPFQPALSFHPSEAHELFVKLGFAAGNALNDVTRFAIPLWAADLQDSVRDINGEGRDHLLTAWYRYAADLQGSGSLAVSVGVIDGTDYLDTNAYSNDEYSQFMNSALVNGPNAFVPSYAPGVAAEWRSDLVSMTGVYMRVGEAHADSFDFVGVQVGVHPRSRFGRGNYRFLVDTTGRDVGRSSDPSSTRLTALLISCDQELGESVGAFVRVGLQSDDASIDYQYLYSGGADIRGAAWRRAEDNIGVGYAHLDGGNREIVRTRVAEVYYRSSLLPGFSITGDIQYMSDDLRSGATVSGLVYGLRATVRF